MKLLFHILALVALFTLVFAWDKEDYEIFDLVTAVENSEGKGTTFYSWLGVSEKANNAEITRAYRKRSLELHPDKNHGVKGANERYARLGVVATILRNEGRERYDFWMKRGVPKWRGTGYYYNRFRPGLGMVFVFLTLVTAGLQHLVHRMTYRSELERVRKFMLLARKAAWGPQLKRIEGARKVKVNIKGNPDVEGEEQEFVPGRNVDMLVQGDEVYLLEDGERHIINEDTPLKPSYKRTWPFALGLYVWSLASGRAPSESEEGEDVEPVDEKVASSSIRSRSKNGSAKPSSSSSSDDEEGEGDAKVKKMPVAAVKAGGRRRKGAKR